MTLINILIAAEILINKEFDSTTEVILRVRLNRSLREILKAHIECNIVY